MGLGGFFGWCKFDTGWYVNSGDNSEYRRLYSVTMPRRSPRIAALPTVTCYASDGTAIRVPRYVPPTGTVCRTPITPATVTITPPIPGWTFDPNPPMYRNFLYKKPVPSKIDAGK